MLGLAMLSEDKPAAEKKKTPQQLYFEKIQATDDSPLVDPKIVKGAFLVVGVSAAFYLISRLMR